MLHISIGFLLYVFDGARILALLLNIERG